LLAATYVLPYRSSDPTLDPDLLAYLGGLVGEVDQVVVVDGSDPEVFAAHRAALPAGVEHVPPDRPTPMGKVGGVLTGVDRARHEAVVLGDDDVRYDADQLARLCRLLDEADVVRPANAFAPVPWHARIDTARTLLNRLWGGDWPGTLGVRRSALVAAGGYRGDVLFENLELVRTLRAAGGTERLAQDLIVVRRPPTTRHHLGQRVRQAYDELARPWRLAWQLALVPVTVGLAVTGRRRLLGALAAGSALAAEVGRRRDGGRAAFPATSSLLTPVWLAERGVCAWLAVAVRLRGGVRYRDGRLRTAASTPQALRARVARTGTAVPPAEGLGQAS
jgi:hypothetical protein